MHYLLGCDEAGYGPNLGPLVIAATAWQLPEGTAGECDLYELLAEVVSSSAEPLSTETLRRLAIADSKLLYQSGGSCARLELAVLVALAALNHRPTEWCQLWPLLAPLCEQDFRAEPWHADYNPPLPLAAEAAEVHALAEQFVGCLEKSQVQLLGLRADCVFPARFNRLCRQHGSKGLLLSTCTLKLVAQLVAELPPGDCTIVADKHGGRNHYSPLLQEAFDDHWVEVRRESRAESSYRIRMPQRTVEICFRAGGEAALPAAWASLCCKYLRELAMDAFNAYWQARVPNLVRTAGYPGDAARFMKQIRPALKAQGISQDGVWRER